MLGSQGIPFEFKIDSTTISMSQEKGRVVYRRISGEDILEKVVKGNVEQVFFTPIEPLNLPKRITPYLLLQLKRNLILEPGSKSKIFLKFPIEIGCFLQNRSEYHMIDVFTFSKSKFTLYGQVKGGLICKYWESEYYDKVPLDDPLREGVLKLDLNNKIEEWVEISQVVLNAFNIKLYYSPKTVSLSARMVIKGPGMADVKIQDRPLKEGMRKGVEVFTPRKLDFQMSSFTMMEGL